MVGILLVTFLAQLMDPVRWILCGLAGYFAVSRIAALCLGAAASLLVWGVMLAILGTRSTPGIAAFAAILAGALIGLLGKSLRDLRKKTDPR